MGFGFGEGRFAAHSRSFLRRINSHNNQKAESV
jgi:hypothetical protein